MIEKKSALLFPKIWSNSMRRYWSRGSISAVAQSILQAGISQCGKHGDMCVLFVIALISSIIERKRKQWLARSDTSWP